jgi:hypothetical protein
MCVRIMEKCKRDILLKFLASAAFQVRFQKSLKLHLGDICKGIVNKAYKIYPAKKEFTENI